MYFNVNSALNLEWKPNINPNLPAEFINSARMAGNCCFAKDVLSAIVMASYDGHIVIEGAQSEYLFGAFPEKAGWDTEDRFGRKYSGKYLMNVGLYFEDKKDFESKLMIFNKQCY